MGLHKFLNVTLFFFLALVAESFSLRSPHQSAIPGTIKPGAGVHTASLLPPRALTTHPVLACILRGGSQQESPGEDTDVVDMDAESPTPEKHPTRRCMTALDATGLTTALVAFGKIYSNSLETWPIVTKSVTAAVLFGISDQMAQAFEIRRARSKGTDKSTASLLTSTNKIRSMWSGIVGFCYFGPASHFWYAWVFKTFPGKSMLSILQKAALGQFFFAPPLFCVFFAAALIQNGQFSFVNWFQKIQKDLVKGWIGGLGFWPIVNYISYAYVPPKFIPLFVNCMGLIFNIYVSLIANLKQGGTTTGVVKNKA